jgi:RNA polymerase sigma-70 factor (ECF subfamily)
VEAITAETMTDLEGFDSQYGVLFADLTALARALGAGPDAEDVAQEALLQARGHLHQLRDPDKLRAWVRRMAIRGACRARRRRVADLDAQHIERLPTADVPDVDVAAAISGLPERERVAVTLVFGLGYRQVEAAELMGVAAGTVYSSVWRARRKLARLLAADEPISAPTGRSAR